MLGGKGALAAGMDGGGTCNCICEQNLHTHTHLYVYLRSEAIHRIGKSICEPRLHILPACKICRMQLRALLADDTGVNSDPGSWIGQRWRRGGRGVWLRLASKVRQRTLRTQSVCRFAGTMYKLTPTQACRATRGFDSHPLA